MKAIQAAEKRIENIADESDDISNLMLEKKPPKFSTKRLIELGLLRPDESLFDKNGTKICTLTDSGYVKRDNSGEISIHKMAAKMLNKNNFNGWDYFYVKRDENFIAIDTLRYEAQEILGKKNQ